MVPAYRESPYLGDCLASLRAQTRPTRIVVTTATPNAHIATLAARFDARLVVNPVQAGIGHDWNFALDAAESEWVTLAHQDDVYLPDFLEQTLHAIEANPDAVLVLTDYSELEGDSPRPRSTLLRIKRFLLELGFLGGARAARRFFKTNTLRFGCAIPCPAVTLRGDGLRFRTDLKVDLDWAAWLELARAPGAFVYVRRALMLHRVHASSETTTGISGGDRAAEDERLLGTLWPGVVARAIVASYRIAYRSNEVDPK